MQLTSYMNILVNIIISKYFSNNCILVISQNAFHYTENTTYVIINVSINTTLDDLLKDALKSGCQNFIIDVQHTESIIERLEYKIKLQTQRYNDRKYLILLSDYQRFLNGSIMRTLHNIPNILYVFVEYNNCSDSTDTFNIYGNCDEIFYLKTNKFTGIDTNDVVLLDVWYSSNGSFRIGKDLYPDKISNMDGRVLKIATFTYKPYSIVGSTTEESDGTEMRIALEYAKQHNCTIEFIVDEHEWGEIYENWTGNGILGNIVMENSDIGFGALYTWYHEFAFLDFSMPVIRSGITCLTPAPRLLSGWLSPFLPFNVILWITVMVAFITVILSFTFVTYYDTVLHNRSDDKALHTILLLTVRIFLLQSWPTLRMSENLPIRCLLSSTLIVSLLIATCYNSGLATSMTIPRYEQAIKTVQDLADSNLKWAATHEAWVFSIKSAKEPDLMQVVHNFKVLTEGQLKRHANTRDLAFAVERLPYGHFAVGPYITKESVTNFLLMAEDIYWERCIFMARKSSPLIPSLNRMILRIHEAGLMSIWETQVVLRHLDNDVQMGIKLMSLEHHQQSTPKKFKISHLLGVYAIWIGGLIIACISFVSELIVFKYKL